MWYTHPVYTRYWQHYQQAMSWHQRHRQAYSKAIEAAYDPAMYPVFPTSSYPYPDGQDDETVDLSQTRRLSEEEEDNSESESSEESEIGKMDITAELRQYFAQTERHKEELSTCVHEIARLIF